MANRRGSAQRRFRCIWPAIYSDAFANGWVQVRSNRRRRGVDRSFAMSDHADWPGLLAAMRATGATRVLATHGFTDAFARYLRETGLDAQTLATTYGDEAASEPADPEASR